MSGKNEKQEVRQAKRNEEGINIRSQQFTVKYKRFETLTEIQLQLTNFNLNIIQTIL